MTTMTDTTFKSRTLDEIVAIRADRVDSYGKPEDNFREIGAYWSEYLQQNLPNIVGISPEGKPRFSLRPTDVAKLMALLKIARDNKAAKHDNMVDAANYLIISGDIEYCNANQKQVSIADQASTSVPLGTTSSTEKVK